MQVVRNVLKSIMEGIASILLLVMMFLTVVDVAFRYFLARPLAASFELTEVLLSLTIYFGIAIVAYSNSHIRIELMEGVLRRFPLVSRTLHVVFTLLLAVALLALSYELTFLGTGKLSEFTPIMHIPMAPVVWLLAAAMFAASLLTFSNLFVEGASDHD